MQKVGDTLKVILIEGFIKRKYIGIKKENQDYFPSFKTPFLLVTNTGQFGTNSGLCRSRLSCALEIRKNISMWIKNNPNIKAGDTAEFTVVEPFKIYKLEVHKTRAKSLY